MKRFAIIFGLIFALATMPLLAPHVVRAGTDYDNAAGGGKTANDDFAVSVHCAATGPSICTQGSATPPAGRINKHVPDPGTGKLDEVHGDVTCLVFNAPYVWISWTVTDSKYPALPAPTKYQVGSTYTFGVADTGGPANGSSSDLVLLDQPSNPGDCVTASTAAGTTSSPYSFSNPFATASVLSGQVQVHQAATTPGTTLSGSGWYTDSSGNLWIQDSTGAWVQIQ